MGGDSAGGNSRSRRFAHGARPWGAATQVSTVDLPCRGLGGPESVDARVRDRSLPDARSMDWFARQYATNLVELRHPYASPLNAQDLSSLPPAMVITGECEPFEMRARPLPGSCRRPVCPSS